MRHGGPSSSLHLPPAAQCTLPAEQPVMVELISETVPLLYAETTPPSCRCEDRGWQLVRLVITGVISKTAESGFSRTAAMWRCRAGLLGYATHPARAP